jgi:cytochrome c-type biogenesis protein CcmE
LHAARRWCDIRRVDRRRKRRLRLIVALTAAIALAGTLVYTSFAGSSETTTPGALLTAADAGRSYELTGRVAPGYRREGGTLHFRVRDRTSGGASVPVTYTGTVPDPFRTGREVIVTVRKEGASFVGEKDSLITKCPSKFAAEKS